MFPSEKQAESSEADGRSQTAEQVDPLYNAWARQNTLFAKVNHSLASSHASDADGYLSSVQNSLSDWKASVESISHRSGARGLGTILVSTLKEIPRGMKLVSPARDCIKARNSASGLINSLYLGSFPENRTGSDSQLYSTNLTSKSPQQQAKSEVDNILDILNDLPTFTQRLNRLKVMCDDPIVGHGSTDASGELQALNDARIKLYKVEDLLKKLSIASNGGFKISHLR